MFPLICEPIGPGVECHCEVSEGGVADVAELIGQLIVVGSLSEVVSHGEVRALIVREDEVVGRIHYWTIEDILRYQDGRVEMWGQSCDVESGTHEGAGTRCLEVIELDTLLCVHEDLFHVNSVLKLCGLPSLAKGKSEIHSPFN